MRPTLIGIFKLLSPPAAVATCPNLAGNKNGNRSASEDTRIITAVLGPV